MFGKKMRLYKPKTTLKKEAVNFSSAISRKKSI